MWLFFAENRTVFLRNSVLDGGADRNLKAGQQQSGALCCSQLRLPDSSATSPLLRAGSHLPCPRRGALRL